MNKRYQVFVSSTYTDLVEERQGVLKAILDLGHIPSGMEGFFAADEEQLSYIKRIIEECDYYVLLLAGRYGSINKNGVSYTEAEYNFAVEKKIPVLVFIHDNLSMLPISKIDSDPSLSQSLDIFKSKVKKNRLVSFWNNQQDLQGKVLTSLAKVLRDSDRPGWVRGNLVASEDILAQLNETRIRAETLRLQLEDAKQNFYQNLKI